MFTADCKAGAPFLAPFLLGPAPWPGDEPRHWHDGANLSPAARQLVRAAFARFDADCDGAMGAHELAALNVATGSGDLAPEDLSFLLETYETRRTLTSVQRGGDGDGGGAGRGGGGDDEGGAAAKAPAGAARGLSARGLCDYYVYALQEDFETTMHDLGLLALHAEVLGEGGLLAHREKLRALVLKPEGGAPTDRTSGGELPGAALTAGGEQAVRLVFGALVARPASATAAAAEGHGGGSGGDADGCAWRRVERGVLGEAELQRFQRAVGSEPMGADDLCFLHDNFETGPQRSGLTERGFVQYFRYALAADFDDAIHDLDCFGVVGPLLAAADAEAQA